MKLTLVENWLQVLWASWSMRFLYLAGTAQVLHELILAAPAGVFPPDLVGPLDVWLVRVAYGGVILAALSRPIKQESLSGSGPQ